MRFNEKEKALWLEDWRQSGKSAWAYAKENGLAPQTFVKWTKAETKQSFVEVPLQVIQAPTQATEILIEKGEVKIHIPIAVGNSGLRAVIESLWAAL